jgi:hypothetical protein
MFLVTVQDLATVNGTAPDNLKAQAQVPDQAFIKNVVSTCHTLRIILPSSSAICGTMALPMALPRSTLLGIP